MHELHVLRFPQRNQLMLDVRHQPAPCVPFQGDVLWSCTGMLENDPRNGSAALVTGSNDRNQSVWQGKSMSLFADLKLAMISESQVTHRVRPRVRMRDTNVQ
jgi:hypothetical protein